MREATYRVGPSAIIKTDTSGYIPIDSEVYSPTRKGDVKRWEKI